MDFNVNCVSNCPPPEGRSALIEIRFGSFMAWRDALNAGTEVVAICPSCGKKNKLSHNSDGLTVTEIA